MGILILYPSPIDTARALNKRELKAQIKLIKERQPNDEWLYRCRVCYERYLAGNMTSSAWWSLYADSIRPAYVTEEFCNDNRNARKAKKA